MLLGLLFSLFDLFCDLFYDILITTVTKGRIFWIWVVRKRENLCNIQKLMFRWMQWRRNGSTFIYC